MATIRHYGLLPASGCYVTTTQPPPYIHSVNLPNTNWVWPALTKHEATAAIWKVAKWGCSRPITPFTTPTDLTTILNSEKDLVCALTFLQTSSTSVVSELTLRASFSTGAWTSFTKYFYAGSYYPIAIRAQYGEIASAQYANQNSVTNNGNLNFTVTVAGISTDFFPEKWWPYDPNDGGGPIYNSSTGEQIRSFP